MDVASTHAVPMDVAPTEGYHTQIDIFACTDTLNEGKLRENWTGGKDVLSYGRNDWESWKNWFCSKTERGEHGLLVVASDWWFQVKGRAKRSNLKKKLKPDRMCGKVYGVEDQKCVEHQIVQRFTAWWYNFEINYFFPAGNTLYGTKDIGVTWSNFDR